MSIAGHTVAAQTPAPALGSDQHEHPSSEADERSPDLPMTREGSGTAWLPDMSPMYAIHWQRGDWQLMAHENAFIQFLHESGDRGADQVGSINWAMGMAQRNLGPGRLQLRAMFSAEPWTIRGCGYPDSLATGEQCNGQNIHDRQHPHDLFMELAAIYSVPFGRNLHWQVYAAPVGEPALGPVAYPHRVSATPNPLAPISHHWLDSTHVVFGVVTGGVYGTNWKAETSVFNGREPDENRTNFDFAPMDSVSGRLWFLPTSHLALQVSAGRLKEAEPGEGIAPRVTVNRLTASATYHRPLRETGSGPTRWRGDEMRSRVTPRARFCWKRTSLRMNGTPGLGVSRRSIKILTISISPDHRPISTSRSFRAGTRAIFRRGMDSSRASAAEFHSASSRTA